MRKIRLETSDGSYVVTAVIPPFVSLPGVFIWGDRVFSLKDTVWPTELGPTYSECFSVAVVSTDDSRIDG